MNLILSLLFIIAFSCINYNIIKNDLIHKKIPNIQLIYLILISPLSWYLLQILNQGNHIIFQYFIFQGIIAIIIGFLLSHYGVWGAGDTKYLLVLSIFIPHISILWLLMNIFFITFLSLFSKLIIFWIKKSLKLKEIVRKIRYIEYKNITKDLNILVVSFQIITYAIFFLLFFSTIRIIRTYTIQNILSSSFSYDILFSITSLIIFLSIFFGIILVLYILKHPFYHYIGDTYVRDGKNKYFFRTISIISLCIFLYWEYLLIGDGFFAQLQKTLTTYLVIYFIIKILFKMYNEYCFQSESLKIPIKKVKEGMTIEKKLSNIPTNIYKKIHRNLKQEDILIMKNNNISEIYIRKTFSFGGYILAGFIFTVIFSDNVILYLGNSVKILIG